MDFTGKRVLVTGGTRGIGRATAEAFLAAGARVAVNGRTEESVAQAMAGLETGERAVKAPGDVGTVAGCEAVVGQAIDGLGGLDVLVNNAGVGEGGRLADCDEASWDRVMNVNLKGTFFCSKFALTALLEAKGNIVNVASVSGLMGHPDGDSIYCASKGGVVNLTRALALELAPDVRVNALCPGVIDTDMLRAEATDDIDALYATYGEWAAMGRVGSPGEMASAILYLASDAASFVTGALLAADGGAAAGR